MNQIEKNKELQRSLNAKGANLVVDGIVGAKTNAAIAQYPITPINTINPGIITPDSITVGGFPDVTQIPNIFNDGAVKPPVTVTSFTDNPNGTTTNTTSDGGKDTGTYVKNADGTYNFVPINSGSNPTNDTSFKDKLNADITRITAEKQSIEDTLSGIADARNSELTNTGVYDKLKQLGQLDETLNRLKMTETLRGTGATTKAEAQSFTSPRLERNAIQALTLSSQINTQLAITNQKFDEERKSNEFIYTEKTKYLGTLQSAYADIITEEQKAGLEYAKSALTANKDLSTQFNADKKTIYEQLLKDGKFEDAGKVLEMTDQSTLTEFLNKQGIITSGLNSQKRADDAVGIVNQVKSILGEGFGVDMAVGSSIFGRILGGTGVSSDFKAKLDRFTAEKTVATLISIKAQGGTFGALSEKELELLQNSATGIKRSSSGGVKMSEESFKEIMDGVQIAAMKVYIGSSIGKEKSEEMGLKYMENKEVEAMYRQKYDEAVNSTNTGNFFPTTNTQAKGNIPQRNNNPGNVKSGGLDSVKALATGIDSQGHLIFPDATSGYKALKLDLEAKMAGRSRFLPANPTLAQLGKVYAEDGNWGRSVASILGVPISTPTTQIPLENLIYAISKQEGFFA